MEEHLAYIERFIAYPHYILPKLDAQHSSREDTQPNIGIHVGVLLGWLIQVMRAQRVVEFGACIGYSAIFLGQALKQTGGTLTAIELNESRALEAEQSITQAGLSDVVTVVHGDASRALDDLDGPFDLILQDSAKQLYPEMLEQCIQKLKPFGVLAADDALFVPMGVAEKSSKPIHEYNQKVFSDSRLVNTILPLGDGLALSVKVSD
ncbi:O-methyltransferase [Candidatus Eisenbacteria bacterium]|uniref:O-methyltransferase n=1 Tax=Eiseniibacteriota bacterium TaxID=2212470 RepID=A0ABV6YML6_UNCEI